MRRALRWSMVVGSAVVILAGLAVCALFVCFPRVAAPSGAEVKATPARLERGAYLAKHVAICVDCHSERDWSRFSAPATSATFGRGGERFGHEIGVPGELVAPNITPHALSDWSDGELVRAITTGVTPDGRVLFPLMPWPAFAQLCQEDLASIVTYVRSLSPIVHDTQESQLDFPVNLIVRTMPEDAISPQACPAPQDTVEYGRYLVQTASCQDCHTPRKGPDLDPERAFSGGVPFPLPSGGVVRSANLTPDMTTGIGSWTRERFIERFAYYRDPAHVPEVPKGAFNTIMPWTMYAGMTDQDLGAIYDYLRTVKPVQVEAAQRFATK